MTSKRHISDGDLHADPPAGTDGGPRDGAAGGAATSGRPGAAARVPDAALLDAAMRCVLAVGVRRTTLTDIARAAGVSRMTVYRRYPDVTTLVAALMTREFGAVLARSADPRTDGSAPARIRLVAAAIETVRLLAGNALLDTVLRLDSELLLPYLVERIGSTQRIAEQFLAGGIRDGHADGSVRPGDPGVQARALFLSLQALVISLRPATAELDRELLLAEYAEQLDGALRPCTPPTEELS